MGLKGVGGDPTDQGGTETREVEGVSLSEEVIWKARAEEAEEKLAMCEARVSELESELASANEALVSTQRRGEIERELTAARAVDLETACLLTEATIGEMDEPDVAVAVRELKARKPFLFSCGKQGGHSGSSMSAQASRSSDGLGQLASSARSSGDRNELLRYLRARRSV
jgi:multidrug resistance efflux pump